MKYNQWISSEDMKEVLKLKEAFKTRLKCKWKV